MKLNEPLIQSITAQLNAEEAARWLGLIESIKAMKRVAVAFSGGIDSSLLAVASWLALGDDMLAVTIHSPVHIDEDDNSAEAVARQFGFPFHTVFHNDLNAEAFVQNPPDRCYVCKLARFSLLKEYALAHGYHFILEGSNADDLNDYRPGAKASKELGARSPLQELGYTKAEIRKVSQLLGIPVWDRPSSPCLATRVPFGTRIRPEDLLTIAQAEALLKQHGYKNVRLRYQSPVARIEVAPEQVTQLVSERDQLLPALKALGIKSVLLDLEGYRSGKLSEEIGVK